MSYFKALLWLFSLVVLAAVLAGAWHFKHAVWDQEREADRSVAEIRNRPVEEFDFGVEKFHEAMDLLAEGEVMACKRVLVDLLRFHQESSKVDDAMRLLGELNLDALLSDAPMEGKRRVEVRRGDSVNRLASEHNSTFHYIVRVNGLTRPESIQPHDQLWVTPLDFRLVIRVADKRLELMDGDYYFASYPIIEVRRPPGLRLPTKTTISGKHAVYDDRRILMTDDNYSRADKFIQLGERWSLRSVLTGQSPPEDGFGIFLSADAIDELNAILRVGNTVEINP